MNQAFQVFCASSELWDQKFPLDKYALLTYLPQMIQKLWLMYNTISDIFFFFFCTWLPAPPTSSERTDFLLHFITSSSVLFHCWCQPRSSNKDVAFDIQSPWVKQYGVSNLQSAIHGHISDEVTQTASQPYNYSILNSFHIKSSVIIYWWLKREKPFVSEQIYFSLKLRPSDFHFSSSAAAETKLLKAQMMRSNVLFG